MPATITAQPQPRLTIPADYLEDARAALAHEIHIDGEAVRDDGPDNRPSSIEILGRDMRLFEQLGAATDETELTAESDHVSSPLFNLLEGMVRVVLERLQDAAQYCPVVMGQILELSTRLRWAAEEGLRLEPSADEGPSVTLTSEERDGLREFVLGHVTCGGDLQVCDRQEDWEAFRKTRDRLNDCIPILDRLGWEVEGDQGQYTIVASAHLVRIARAIRPAIEGTIEDDQRGTIDDDQSHDALLERDRAALRAVDAIEEAAR